MTHKDSNSGYFTPRHIIETVSFAPLPPAKAHLDPVVSRQDWVTLAVESSVSTYNDAKDGKPVGGDQPSPTFSCPIWPECGCPDGAVKSDCPKLESAIPDDDGNALHGLVWAIVIMALAVCVVGVGLTVWSMTAPPTR